MNPVTSLVKTLTKPMNTFLSPTRPVNDTRNGLVIQNRGIICPMRVFNGQTTKTRLYSKKVLVH
jgi:hypothetical protein